MGPCFIANENHLVWLIAISVEGERDDNGSNHTQSRVHDDSG